MKLKDLYANIVRVGIEKDPRGKNYVFEALKEAKKSFEELPKAEKRFFDSESLNNPYGDTRILWGSGEKEVKSVLIGIDMEAGEIILADRLKEKGERIDLILSHHPEGVALANLSQVMGMHADILTSVGVPVSVAESILATRIQEVERRLMPANHMRSIDFARILDIPFMSAHTVADNCVMTYLTKLFQTKKPKRLGDIIDILLEIPEYEAAAKHKSGPNILVGNKKSRCGKILVDMTGGTESAKEIFDNLVKAGIATFVCMHLSEEHFKKAQEAKINVIIAGHIASDTVGLNLLLDEVEKKEKLKYIECSGFRRVKR